MTQQALPSKEQTLFRHLIQNYESKQYKKGLKVAEQILKKHPNHGDTQAMKALILSSQGKQEEAFELCKLALKNAMKSHVCWHVYGLLYRSVKNYEEAIKAYKFALRIDADNAQIQRDLSVLQMQMRDYHGLIQSRQTMVKAKPHLRQNWTALAIAHHLNGDLKQAESILSTYEDTLKDYKPTRTDLEHQEASLYKISIISEQGENERALEQLNLVSKSIVDRTIAIELKAEYLLKAGKAEEAAKVYRVLLDRNPERRAYYDGLERASGLDRQKASDHAQLTALYGEYAAKSERRDAPRRIPLDFLEGAEFEKHAEQYLRRMFTKGVPSTFANLKQLYSDESRQKTIVDIVERLSKEQPQTNGSTKPGSEQQDRWGLSANYFLAQHFDYHLTRDLDRADQYIEKAISLNPSKTDYTYHMTKARILKHRGETEAASKAMNAAREMDLKDRYINTKCAKYQLRNDENQTATDTMGLFTRKEAVGGPLGDLLDMQCVWFITEDGESYLRQGKLALALKRFEAVYTIFDTWFEDQFDFHTFSLRKGMIRSYVDMIRWEDGLREHPFYTRAALLAIKICLMLADKPELGKDGQLNGTDESAADKKKAAKKARKEAEKAEAERKAAAAKNATPKAEDTAEAKKEDKDPQGLDRFKIVSEKPLDEAMKYLTPLLELSPRNVDAQIAGFDVFIRRGKLLPALKCMKAAQKLGSKHPAIKQQDEKFKTTLQSTRDGLPEKVKAAIDELYPVKSS